MVSRGLDCCCVAISGLKHLQGLGRKTRKEGITPLPWNQADGRSWSDTQDVYEPFTSGFLLSLSLTHIFSLADSHELPHYKENVFLIIH